MVNQELVDGLNEITEECAETVKLIRKDFVSEVVSAYESGDTTFDYTSVCLKYYQMLRRCISMTKENDIFFLDSMQLDK